METAKTNYYSREQLTHLDGTPIFQTEADQKIQRLVAARLEAAWGCQIRYFGALSPIDWYAERFGRLTGVLEFKNRSNGSKDYETVALNVRKWLTLTLASHGLGCPAIFVVQFTDALMWIPVREIDARKHFVNGAQRPKAAHDIEPMIGVEIALMRKVNAYDATP